MKIGRGVAAGAIVVACLSIFGGCFLDWDLSPLAASGDAASDVGAVDDAPGPGAEGSAGTSDAGCSSNADCAGLCYFAGTTCTGTGVCVESTPACSANSALGNGTAGKVCGCDSAADACAPAGAAAKCAGLPASDVTCGYLSCPSATTFCVAAASGRKFECKPWSAESCSATSSGASSEHTCTCAKKACVGGTCAQGGAAVVITCP